jgi:hypothetical protein
MRLAILLATVLLTGCLGTAPIVPKFPDPPGKDAFVRCPDLERLKDQALLSEIAKTINNNYGEYYTCAVRADIWIEWYQIQKKIYEDLK